MAASAETAIAGGEDVEVEQPDYEILAKLLSEGEIIPFLGAGASVFENPEDVSEDDANLYPPTVKELAGFLADKAKFPKDGISGKDLNLALVASYLGLVKGGEKYLRISLREKFMVNFKSTILHELLAKIVKKGRKLLIVTTNYDDMIESAFDKEKQPYHLVITNISDHEMPGAVQYRLGPEEKGVRPIKPTKLDISLDDASIIYKMHGSVNKNNTQQDGYIISEEHYTRFLGSFSSGESSLVPPAITREMIGKQFLFLGYGLRDWNLRVLLETLSPRGRTKKDLSWAVQAPEEDEKKNWWNVEKKIWSKKNVEVYGIDLRDFVERLELCIDGIP